MGKICTKDVRTPTSYCYKRTAVNKHWTHSCIIDNRTCQLLWQVSPSIPRLQA